MQRINRLSISHHLSSISGLSSRECSSFVNDYFDTMLDICYKHGSFNVKYFGKFSYFMSKRRKILNIYTRQESFVKSRYVMKFTPSKKLKEFLRNNVVQI